MKYKEKKHRQYRSNQGRSPENMESKYKGCGLTLILFVITLMMGLIFRAI
tara:strand:+ start:3443 stop:3592 length:150 start_codon:yes stop_codon:yes gene_type:complete